VIEVFDKKELDAELSKSNQVLALFYSSGCPFCKRFVMFFDHEAVKSDIAGVIHVRLDDYSSRLWDDYSIPVVPSVIYFENGKVSKRLNGRLGRGLSEADFISWLKQLKR